MDKEEALKVVEENWNEFQAIKDGEWVLYGYYTYLKDFGDVWMSAGGIAYQKEHGILDACRLHLQNLCAEFEMKRHVEVNKEG